MRKVIYQYWIHSKRGPDGITSVIGTGCFSEMQSGYFHGWGMDMHEDANSVVMYSVALIEDVTTGHMHKVDPEKMRFVQPQDLRQHKSDILEIKTAGGSKEDYALQERIYALLVENKPFENIKAMVELLQNIYHKL